MRRRPTHPVRTALATLLALVTLFGLAACVDENADRQIGDPITEGEAETLAGLLNRNFTEGGASFRASVPYAEATVFTYTGTIDFTTGTGTGTAVTDYNEVQPTESRSLYFSTDNVTFGDVPGLTDAMTAVGVPNIVFMTRQLLPFGQELIDSVVTLLPRLSAREADNAQSYLERDYTFQGQTTIDGELAGLFSFGAATVAVSVDDQELLQYVTSLPDVGAEITITLSDHGPKTVAAPPAEQTANATDYPDVAGAVGV